MWRSFIQRHADMVSKDSLKIIQKVLHLGVLFFFFSMAYGFLLFFSLDVFFFFSDGFQVFLQKVFHLGGQKSVPA